MPYNITDFITFLRIKQLCKMQEASYRIRTRVTVSISYNTNHCITNVYIYIYIYMGWAIKIILKCLNAFNFLVNGISIPENRINKKNINHKITQPKIKIINISKYLIKFDHPYIYIYIYIYIYKHIKLTIFQQILIAQSVRTIEYTDFITGEG